MAKEREQKEAAMSTEGEVSEESVKKQKDSWLVKVKNNPDFCGIGAGGIQFANGKALVTSRRMAEWFREHEGYEVAGQ